MVDTHCCVRDKGTNAHRWLIGSGWLDKGSDWLRVRLGFLFVSIHRLCQAILSNQLEATFPKTSDSPRVLPYV